MQKCFFHVALNFVLFFLACFFSNAKKTSEIHIQMSLFVTSICVCRFQQYIFLNAVFSKLVFSFTFIAINNFFNICILKVFCRCICSNIIWMAFIHNVILQMYFILFFYCIYHFIFNVFILFLFYSIHLFILWKDKMRSPL